MAAYRYWGRRTEIGSIVLKKFGGRIELDDALAYDAIIGGCSLLPEAEWDQVGFNAVEIADKRQRSGAAYMAKVDVARAIMNHHADKLKATLADKE